MWAAGIEPPTLQSLDSLLDRGPTESVSVSVKVPVRVLLGFPQKVLAKSLDGRGGNSVTESIWFWFSAVAFQRLCVCA